MREVLPDDLADEVRGYLDDFGVSVAEDALDDLRASERRALTFRMPDGERVPIEGLYQPSFKTADLRRIEHGADDRLLLITDYVHPRSAEALRTAGVWYVDGPGNAHIRWPGLFVDVQGRKRPAGVGGAPRTRRRSTTLFTRKKSQVIAAILARPDLLREPFRTVAHCSGTSLGLVKTVIDDLAGMGFVEDGSGGRRPGDLDALLGLWAPSYAAQVPTPFGGEGTVAPVVPEGIELLLSGEQAVPELIVDGPTLTAYVDTDDREGLPTDLIRVNRWRRSETPNIRLRHKFWQDLPGIHEGAAPAPIVYADLIGANEGRQREAAGEVRARWIRSVESTIGSMRT